MASYQGYKGYGDPEAAKVERSRQMAELLQQNALQTQPTNLVTGLASLGEAFLARRASERADAAETAYSDNRKKALDLFINQQYPDAQGIAQNDLAQPAAFDLTPGAMEQRKTAGGQADKVRSLADLLGGDVLGAMQLHESMKPEPKKYTSVEFGTGGVGSFDPTTGTMQTIVEPTMKPEVAKAPTVNQFGQMWDEAQGRWVEIPGAMDNYGKMHPEKPAGAGPQLTPYQQHQIDRADQADKEKKTAADEQRRVLLGSLDDSITRIDSLINSKGFNGLYGPIGAFGLNMGAKPTNMMNQDELNANALLDQIGGEAFLAGVAKMRGAGAVSENEGKKVMAAVQHLTNRLQSPEAARAAAIEFQQSLRALKEAYTREGGGSATPPPPQQPNMLDQIGGAVGGFMQNMMGGNRRPAPAQDDVSDLLKKYGQ